MHNRTLVAALFGTLLGTASFPALPSTDRWHGNWHDRHERSHPNDEQHRLVHKYAKFAGSEQNSKSLVNGLRNDREVRLSNNGKSTSFTPATDKMGYGNVDNALALAKHSLAKHGIRNPTPEQIKAALNGGTITDSSGKRVQMQGVLQMRASGMGWGEIAQKQGTKLGHIKGRHGHGHGHGHHKHADGKRHHDKHAHKKHDHDHKHADWKHHHDKKHHHKHADWKHDRHNRHAPKPDHNFHRAKF